MGEQEATIMVASRKLRFFSALAGMIRSAIGETAEAAWSTAKAVVTTAASAVNTAIEIAGFVTTGNAPPIEEEHKHLSWSVSKTSPDVGSPNVALRSFSASMQYTISFQVRIRDHKVEYGHAIAEGDADFAADPSVEWRGEAAMTGHKEFRDLWEGKSIPFRVAGFPFRINITVPVVNVTWKLQASASVQANAGEMRMRGKVKYGIVFSSEKKTIRTSPASRKSTRLP
jgi:hypothetical protein